MRSKLYVLPALLLGLTSCGEDTERVAAPQALAECPVAYSDAGLPEGGDIFVWPRDGENGLQGPSAQSTTQCEGTPEGSACFRLKRGEEPDNYGGWGVFIVRGKLFDLSSCESLAFCVRTEEELTTLKVEIQPTDDPDTKGTYLVTDLRPGEWQPVVLPKSEFGTIALESVYGIFLVTANGGNQTYYVDDVRWLEEGEEIDCSSSADGQGAGGEGGAAGSEGETAGGAAGAGGSQ